MSAAAGPRALGFALCVVLAYLAWQFTDDFHFADHYAVLALPHDCTKEDIRAAYKRLALQNHPDKTRSLDASSQEKAKKLFLRVNEAHEILSDELQRTNYDEMLKFQPSQMEQKEQGLGGGRSWSWWFHFVMYDMTIDLFLFLLWHALSLHNLLLLLTCLGLSSVGLHLLLTSISLAFWAARRTSVTVFTTEAAKLEAQRKLSARDQFNAQRMLAARDRQQHELMRRKNG
jgi:curved DNA-binding protein CbpA